MTVTEAQYQAYAQSRQAHEKQLAHDLQIRTVDYDLYADTVTAGVYLNDKPLARVELRLSPKIIQISCEYVAAADEISGHDQTMLPARVVDTLFNACTADDEILYVPSENALPLAITL